MEREWVSTGHREVIDSQVDKIPEFDPRKGEHFWIVITTYKVDPSRVTSPDPTVTPMLDHESLVAVVGPGCYYCEQVYEPVLKHRRCKGQP